MSAPLPSFRLDAPLPTKGTSLIEASAGTGKTFTLTSMMVRYVAELDVPVGSVLVVTFTRAATAELRDRIRRGLAAAAAHLAADVPGRSGDPVLDLLARGHREEVAERHRRLERAVADFDTATVSTIHGFCAQVRASLGLLSGEHPDAVPAESEAELVREVCADLLFGRLAGASEDPLGGRSLDTLVELVTTARTLADCEVRADSGRPEDLAVAGFVTEAVDVVDERLRRSGGLSYDSLLSTVRRAVTDSPELAAELRRQFRVALVDEFQDTDPVQWEVFRTVFGGRDSALVLVGDPKQAIYAFRGGDVYTYLDARRTADVQALDTNQRSDRPVVEALNALADGQVYGEPEIAYQQVAASERHAGRRLVLGGSTAPGLVLRCVAGPEAIDRDDLDASRVRTRIAADLAEVAARLLTEGAIEDPDAGRPSRRVRPGDLAVLVSATSHAAPMAAALRRIGIPAVLRLKDSVATGDAADQWRTVLQALERPASPALATGVALGWFCGWPAERVAEAAVDGSDAASALVDLQHELRQWAELLSSKGFPALFGELRRRGDFMERMLGRPGGERDLTDLEHLAELVHAGSASGGSSSGLGPAAALAILGELAADATDELAADAVQRRTESDADHVQILTVHGAKGLEFPVVLLPTMFGGGNRVKAPSPLVRHDRQAGTRVLDVSSKGDAKNLEAAVGPAYGEATRQNAGDQHRLTYVALTRAAHQTVAWWCVPSKGQGTERSGLTRLLLGAGAEVAADEAVAVGADPLATIRARVAGLEAGGSLTPGVVEVVALERPATPVEPVELGGGPDTAPLAVAVLGRPLARDVRRWSFSKLKRHISTETFTPADPTVEFAEDAAAHDEVPDAPTPPEDPVAGPPDPRWDAPTGWEDLGGGTALGNLVHDVLEHVDLTATDLEAEVAEVMAGLIGHVVDPVQRRGLPGAIAAAARTPLGSAYDGLRLADLTAADRLNELNFYLPLSPDAPVRAGSIGTCVARHLERDHPLRPWAEGLARGLAPVPLQGLMNGSIDLVLRSGGKCSVVDYKTNLLTPRGATPRLADYHPDRLPAAMAHHQYALQALVYSVSLHRYLRWRQAGYSPERHLGPVGYLFVRGMVGPDTPTDDAGRPAGVFTWSVPPALVVELSDLFAGSAP